MAKRIKVIVMIKFVVEIMYKCIVEAEDGQDAVEKAWYQMIFDICKHYSRKFKFKVIEADEYGC